MVSSLAGGPFRGVRDRTRLAFLSPHTELSVGRPQGFPRMGFSAQPPVALQDLEWDDTKSPYEMPASWPFLFCPMHTRASGCGFSGALSSTRLHWEFPWPHLPTELCLGSSG